VKQVKQVNKSSPYKSGYRFEIDGLRAFAVLSVVAFHAFPSLLKGGFIGVDVFFVISGFLITIHIFENLDKGKFSFTDFFGRRIRRIFPALILVMVSSLAFGWFVLLADEYAQLGKHVASGAAFITNFILVNESGYFDNIAETKPMLHLWSLAVEEQFYIFWPLVLWLAWIRKLNLLVITVLVAFFSFYVNLYFIKSNPTEIFFFPVGRLWELLSGSILAWLLFYKGQSLSEFKIWIDKSIVSIININKYSTYRSFTSNLMSFFGFLLLAYSVIYIHEGLSFPSYWALIPVMGSMLVIASGSEAWLNRVFLMNPIAVWFGLISYPLYLWHWPILSFLHIINGFLPESEDRLLGVLLSILFAWLTYRFLEKPIRSAKLTIKLSIRLFIVTALIGLLGFYVFLSNGIPSRTDAIKSETDIVFNEKIKAEFSGIIWDYTNNEACMSKYEIEGAEEWGHFFCTLSKDLPPTIILLGNSYANHYYVGFANSKRLAHHSILSIGTCGVEWPSYEEKIKEEVKGGDPCLGRRELVQFEHINKIIETENSLKYAVLVLDTEKYIDEKRFELLLRRIKFIRASGLEVILFQSHLEPKFNINSCYRRVFLPPTNNCAIDPNKLSEHNEVFNKLVEKLSQQVEVHPFNPNEIFCETGVCSYILDGGMPSFRDPFAHFSKFASERLVDQHFIGWSKKNLPNILK